jgi:3-hydroxyacyl-CoA dehydrogenase
MLYADMLGLYTAMRRMRGFAALPGADSAFWTPAPLLVRLAADGRTLNG